MTANDVGPRARPVRTRGEPPGSGAPAARRWIALVVIAVAQLMTALDATIVNIALPSAQRSLGFGDADRQWVITAYTLAFAGLLLLGGRIADRFGRRRAFMVGLVGFAAASALAGAAPGLPASSPAGREALSCAGSGVVGVHAQRAAYRGQAGDGRFRATHIAVRQEGEWKLAGIHMSPMGAPSQQARGEK